MNSNKRTLGLYVALACFWLASSPANAILYDFNTIPTTGVYTEEDFSAFFPGISFENTGGDSFRVIFNSVINWTSMTPGNSTIVTFDFPIISFSVTMGDQGGDADFLYLYAYDSDNNEIDSDFFINPADSSARHTLSVSGNITSVEFYGVGSNYNSVFWDNIEFNTVPGPPIAIANGPYVQNEGAPVNFDGSGSFDPEGTPLQYRWDFDNDGLWDTDWQNDPTAVNIWPDDYSGTVALEVTDGEFTDISTTTITVLNVAPTISIDVVRHDGLLIFPGDTVEFEASMEDPGTQDYHVFEWYANAEFLGYELSVSHIFSEPGRYFIFVEVQDDDGATTTDEVSLIVSTPETAVDDIEDIIEEMDMPEGIENGLKAKLNAVLSSLAEGSNNRAANQLQAFINQVEAKRGKTLTDEEADLLISLAEEILQHI